MHLDDTRLVLETSPDSTERMRISCAWNDGSTLGCTLLEVVATRPRPAALGEVRTASARALERALRREEERVHLLVRRALRRAGPPLSQRAQLQAQILLRALPAPPLLLHADDLELTRLALELATHAPITSDLSDLALDLLSSAREAYES